MGGSGVLTNLIKGGAKAASSNLDTAPRNLYRKANKELKEAINNRIYERDPMLFHTEAGHGRSAGEIPRLNAKDVQEYYGVAAGENPIPSAYKSRSDELGLDVQMSEYGYDTQYDVDDMMSDIETELEARARDKAKAETLRDLRNDPEFVAETQKLLEQDYAKYAFPETFEPSTRDYMSYLRQAYPEEFKFRSGSRPSSPQQPTTRRIGVLSINDGGDFDIPVAMKKYLPQSPATSAVPRDPAPQARQTTTPQSVIQSNIERQASPAVESNPSTLSTLARILGLQGAVSE